MSIIKQALAASIINIVPIAAVVVGAILNIDLWIEIVLVIIMFSIILTIKTKD